MAAMQDSVHIVKDRIFLLIYQSPGVLVILKFALLLLVVHMVKAGFGTLQILGLMEMRNVGWITVWANEIASEQLFSLINKRSNQ